MPKAGERAYFKVIGEEAVEQSLQKPFSGKTAIGGLLHDIAAVFSLFPGSGEKLKILDIGCGSGWTSNFYAQAGHDVTGLDIAPEAIEAAKKRFGRLPNLEFVCHEYDSMPYKDSFDVAIFFDALHHAENELEGLSAAYQALKPGGAIIICEPGRGHAKNPVSIRAMEMYGVNERDMPPKLSRKQVKKAGFKKITTYAYPAIAHRALYANSSKGVTKYLRSSPLMRALTVALTATLLRRWHGIVVATK